MAVFIPQETKDKNTEAIGQIVSLVLYFVFIILFEKILSWFIKPFTKSSVSAEEIIKKKQEDRENYLNRIDSDESDPMHQYQLRVLDQPKLYKNDPDTKIYKKWYDSWRSGEIIDNGLRWAPRIYISNEILNPKFLEYMKIQYDLHKRASWIERIKFIRTINRYYPEFSCNFNNLGQDISRYAEVATKEAIKSILYEEIKRLGFSEEYEQYLSNLTVDEVKKAIPFFRQCIKEDLMFEAVVYSWESNLSILEAKVINFIVKRDLPAYVGMSYLNDEITDMEIIELSRYNNQILDDYDNEVLFCIQPNGRTYYEEFIDKQLKKYRMNKRIKRPKRSKTI